MSIIESAFWGILTLLKQFYRGLLHRVRLVVLLPACSGYK